MRILVIGSGGREHALAAALAQSPRDPEIFAAPGNPGTAEVGTNVDVASDDLDGLVAFAREASIDLTIVGPEKPLVAGIVDRFEDEGLAIVGPSASAARLEGSKAFADQFMGLHGIPTARFRVFDAEESELAHRYLDDRGAPIVVKADGLAGGKGVFVCKTLDEAHDALDTLIEDRAFGDAGKQVVIEDCLEGPEASVFALTDGEHYVLLPPSQDHKRIGDGNTGPNTGGMGAYAPTSVLDAKTLTRVCREIIEPTLAGMQEEDIPYRGVLYCGLMLTEDGPKVIEYNCRLGDPETQVVLPLVDSDLVDVFEALVHGELDTVSVRASADVAATVVLASEGYPLDYETGVEITGVNAANALDGVSVIHAGTKRRDDGTLVTDGGRVLNVVGRGPTLPDALKRAYDGVDAIDFDGKTFRTDIGHAGLEPADA